MSSDAGVLGGSAGSAGSAAGAVDGGLSGSGVAEAMPDAGAPAHPPSAEPHSCPPTAVGRTVCHDSLFPGCECPSGRPCCLACDGPECTCPAGRSCDILVLDQAQSAHVQCGVGTHCRVTTESRVDLQMHCQPGGSCDVDCRTTGRCKTTCAFAARCRTEEHGTSSHYQLVCKSGHSRTCPAGELACHSRDCH